MAHWRHDPTSDVPGRARRALTAQLCKWGIYGVDEDDLAMVLSELVTNAVEHACTPLTVSVGLLPADVDADHGAGAGGRVVRIEVADDSTAPPRLRPQDRGATRGRGLQMITALANRWGHTATATGKTVWAELRLGPAGGWPRPAQTTRPGPSG